MVIARLREIATQSADALLLADGPVHPDHELLGLCGEALYHLNEAARLLEERERIFVRSWRDQPLIVERPQPPLMDDEHYRSLVNQRGQHIERARLLQRAAQKLPSITGAGLYAKALCSQITMTGSPRLAVSMARDIASNPKLRASLWPAGVEEPA